MLRIDGAAIGHAVLHGEVIHLHVMRLADVDDAELVAEQAGCVHLRVRAGGDRDANCRPISRDSM
jgi:hypothetical protein